MNIVKLREEIEAMDTTKAVKNVCMDIMLAVDSYHAAHPEIPMRAIMDKVIEEIEQSIAQGDRPQNAPQRPQRRRQWKTPAAIWKRPQRPHRPDNRGDGHESI